MTNALAPPNHLSQPQPTTPHVVIIGGGFGGLEVAKALRKTHCRVTLLDRRNHHVFQPLLYQVATANLSPAEIASPIRKILRGVKNCRVLLGEVEQVDLTQQRIHLHGHSIRYDYLILAAGATHSYFGRDDFAQFAPGLKTLEDALAMRHRILLSFEEAEYEEDPDSRRAKLTFVIIGGGPTGVELAGAIKEISTHSLPKEFRNIDTTSARVLLVEGADRLLGTFSPSLSQKALQDLHEMGVEVLLNSKVTNITQGEVAIGDLRIATQNIFWAAGVQANPLSQKLGAQLDRAGRIVVQSDCSIPSHPDAFVIGDMAAHQDARSGKPVPGVAQGAIQTGIYVGKLLHREISGRQTPAQRKPFAYFDKGSLATIGRSRAVGEVFGWKVTGFIAWTLWAGIHIMFLVEFRNRLLVGVRWFWNWLLHSRDTRLIVQGTEMNITKVLAHDVEPPTSPPQDTSPPQETLTSSST